MDRTLYRGIYREQDVIVIYSEAEEGLWGEAMEGYIRSDGIGDFKDAEDVRNWLERQVDFVLDREAGEARKAQKAWQKGVTGDAWGEEG